MANPKENKQKDQKKNLKKFKRRKWHKHVLILNEDSIPKKVLYCTEVKKSTKETDDMLQEDGCRVAKHPT